MSNLSDKINYLNETKSTIKQAIINKGINITDTDTFRSYADKISLISQNNDDVIDMKGCVLWIDSQHNLRSGCNHSVTYLEDLQYTNVTAINSSYGFKEYVAKTDGEWDGDFLKFNGFAYYQNLSPLPKLTMEFLFKISSFGNNIYATSLNGGFSFGSNDELQTLRLSVRASNSYNYLAIPDGVVELNIPYYAVINLDRESATASNISYKMKLYSANFDTPMVLEGSHSGYSSTSTSGAVAASSASNYNPTTYSGVSVAMIRGWNRILSDVEIEERWNDVKKRFTLN